MFKLKRATENPKLHSNPNNEESGVFNCAVYMKMENFTCFTELQIIIKLDTKGRKNDIIRVIYCYAVSDDGISFKRSNRY